MVSNALQGFQRQRRLPQLQVLLSTELHDEHASGGRLAVISLSLDADKASARRFVAARDLPWTQGYLGDGSESSIGVLYGVNSVPSYHLIAPDGTLVYRGDGLKEARQYMRETR